MIINCIAVDDEPPALKLLTMFIGQTSFLNLKGVFDNGIEALKYVTENHVDLIFLDIQMSDITGVEIAGILNRRNAQSATKIIFTTAFDKFAIEGYRLNILDYLLKPYTYEDFLRASKKSSSIKSDNIATSTLPVDTFLYLRVDFQVVKIAFNQILYIEGLKDYAKVYLKNEEKPILSLITLKLLEEKLPTKQFMRVHKSFIVAVNKITAITRNSLNIADKIIPVSEAYKESFMILFNQWV
jgi:two-component system response regulator LytT